MGKPKGKISKRDQLGKGPGMIDGSKNTATWWTKPLVPLTPSPKPAAPSILTNEEPPKKRPLIDQARGNILSGTVTKYEPDRGFALVTTGNGAVFYLPRHVIERGGFSFDNFCLHARATCKVVRRPYGDGLRASALISISKPAAGAHQHVTA
jgi:hypothetical protein